MSRILPLPAEAVSGIQSSKQITDLQGVVLSLLQNSLDAGSNRIEIAVDFRRGGCVIEDNGSGILPTEFLESGGLGKLYHTSKYPTTECHELHGSTGTYLASLGALSLLNITSKHLGGGEVAEIMIYHGKTIARHDSAPQRQGLTLSPAHGTRVTVRDLFGNMPVRVKQRALLADSPTIDANAWHELKHGVVALLLAWTKPCSVKIQDVYNRSRRLQLAAQHASASHTLTKKSLSELASGRTKFDLRDVLPILFQSTFAPAESRTRWIPLSASSPGLDVKGSICLEPAPSKNCQFISLGTHPCVSKNGYAELYESINRLFSSSSFGAMEHDSVDIDEAEKDRRKYDRRFNGNGPTRKQLLGRKGVDRWPMFVIQVRSQDQRERGKRTGEKNLRAIMEILKAAVWEWLFAHHFRPVKNARQTNKDIAQTPGCISRDSPSRSGTPLTGTLNTGSLGEGRIVPTAKKRRVVDMSRRPSTADLESDSFLRPMSGDFSTWSRIKSGKPTFYDEIWEKKKPVSTPEGRMESVTEAVRAQVRSCNLPTIETGQLSARRMELDRSDVHSDGSDFYLTSLRQPVNDSLNSSDDFGSIDVETMMLVAEAAENDTRLDTTIDAIIDWSDPHTKQRYKVNSRTGVVLPTRPRSHDSCASDTTAQDVPSRTSAAINTSHTSAGLPLSLLKRPSSANREQGHQWLPGFLKDWNNPVFVRQEEEPIRVTSFDDPGIDTLQAASKRCSHETRTSYFDQEGEICSKKLSKLALKHASVVRQVDRKFILCTVPEEHNEILVLLDQHAASERVILEKLLEELCAVVPDTEAVSAGSRVRTKHLEKPLHFQIPAVEHELFERHSKHFADWGIVYDLRQIEEELPPSQVRSPKQEYTIMIRRLPPGIAERCMLVPKLLIELLRSEVWTISSSTQSGVQQQPTITSDHLADRRLSHSWLTRIGSCPKGMIGLLNSRACRSAVMFNDELSIEQCEQLLNALSNCAFPFMCAHGRVSMVPLVELRHVGERSAVNEISGNTGDQSEEIIGFVEAFQRWQRDYIPIDKDESPFN